MYEILLSLAGNMLKDGVIQHDKAKLEDLNRVHQIALEMIKTKNQMATKRFEYSLAVSNEIAQIQTKLHTLLVEFKRKCNESDKDLLWTSQTIRECTLDEEIHRPTLRSYLDARNKLEAINDLFAIYSQSAARFLSFDNFLTIFSKKFPNGASTQDLVDFHFSMFGHALGLIISLIRCSSDDLRFWLVEADYSEIAEEFASKDFVNFAEALSGNADGLTYGLLEKAPGRKKFWEEVAKKIDR